MKKKQLSYEEKLNIMYAYLSDKNKILARTKFEGYPIGQWQSHMRTEYYKGNLKLDIELEKKLLGLGILRKEKARESAKRLTWSEKLPIMEEYLKSGKKIEHDTIYKGYRIGQWQATIRHSYYSSPITIFSLELKKKFFELGILQKEKAKYLDRGAKKLSYDEKFEIMYQYLEKSNFEEDISQKTTFKDQPIGVWQDNLRQTYRKGRDLEINPELLRKFFTYGILREEDKKIRKARISGQTSKTSPTPTYSKDTTPKEQLIKILLDKQQERKTLDEEIAQLEELINSKNNDEIEI